MRMRIRHGLSTATKFLAVVCSVLSSVGPAYAQYASAYEHYPFCNQDQIVHSQAELDLLRACIIFNGHLTIDANLKSAQISGIQIIRGNLTAVNQTQTESIIAPNLSYIDGALRVIGAPMLESVGIPNLAYLGSIHLENLPTLDSFNTSTKVLAANRPEAPEIVIRSTGIGNIDWLLYTFAAGVQIIDNPRMRNIRLPIKSADLLEIRNNGRDATVALENLVYCRDLYIKDGVGNLTLPRLYQTTGDVSLSNNTYSALELPALETVGIDFDAADPADRRFTNLTVDASPNLRTVSFPMLKIALSSLILNGSSNWKVLNGFPSLQQVSSLFVDGNFTTVEFPKLESQRSTSVYVKAEVSCNDFIKQEGIAHRNFTVLMCNEMIYNTTTDTLGPLSAGDEAQSSMPMGAKAGIAVGVASALGLVVSAAFYHCRRTGRRWLWIYPAHKNVSELSGDTFKAELGDDRMRPELSDGRSSPAELDDGTMRPELEGSGPIAELDGTPKLSPTTSQLLVFESTIPEIGEGSIR
ncbi:hypothetical protein TWF696_002894 [Orbilia brochopaga]|uniref:Uncharacterized protein n=1 Tax=Orbilia brochopaga TaxID=3140254 RepID=A0AAV9U1D1_9PEZI